MRKGRESRGALPAELVDAYFDRELDAAGRDDFFGRLRGDLAACEDVARTQRVVSALREPVEAPDLSQAIMAEVRRRRGFVPLRIRRVVSAGRLAVAATLLLALMGYGLARRWEPGLSDTGPARMTNVVRSTEREASRVIEFRSVIARTMARPGEHLYQSATLVPGRIIVRTFPDTASGEVLRAAAWGGEADGIAGDKTWLWTTVEEGSVAGMPIWSAEWRGGLLTLPESGGEAPRRPR
ncbi:MAG: hypothetical protein ACKVW3_15165 [Phycisphaerales bacterium]